MSVIEVTRGWKRLLECRLLMHLQRLPARPRFVAHSGGSLQLIPRKTLPFDGAFQRFEQNNRKQLAIGKPLQPHLAEQADIFFRLGLAAFQSKGNRRGDEVNDQECGEE